jgi:diguanylate cyclase (GGDEF)-like protein
MYKYLLAIIGFLTPLSIQASDDPFIKYALNHSKLEGGMGPEFISEVESNLKQQIAANAPTCEIIFLTYIYSRAEVITYNQSTDLDSLSNLLSQAKASACSYVATDIYKSLKNELNRQVTYIKSFELLEDAIAYFELEPLRQLSFRLTRLNLFKELQLPEEYERELSGLNELFNQSEDPFIQLAILDEIDNSDIIRTQDITEQELLRTKQNLTKNAIDVLKQDEIISSLKISIVSGALYNMLADDEFATLALYENLHQWLIEHELTTLVLKDKRLIAFNYEISDQYNKAIEIYQYMISLAGDLLVPAVFDAYSFLGNAYETLEDYESALTVYKKHNAFELYGVPEFTSQYNIAQLLVQLNRYDEAAPYIERIKSIDVVAPWSINKNRLLIEYYKAINNQGQLTNAYLIKILSLEDQVARLSDAADNKKNLQDKFKQEWLRSKDAEQEIEYYRTITLWLSFGLFTILLILSLVYGLRKRRQYNHQKYLAATDTLTGSPNRRHALLEGRGLVESAYSHEQTCCVALLDIDFFKRINDTYGHDKGDEALKLFYQAISASIREVDVVGRYGGEEWLMVMKLSSQEVLQNLFEKIRDAYSECTKLHLGLESTFSMGAVLSTDPNYHFDQLISIADDQLYRSKEQGRNKLSVVHKTL